MIRLPDNVTLDDAERVLIEAAMIRHEGNKIEAAKQLGCCLKTLYNKLNAYEKAGKGNP